jgi:O-antigen ligase
MLLIHLLISSIIPFLILGPFFPDLIVSLSSLVFLAYMFKNNDYGYFKINLLTIFFLFCLYCIVISVFVVSDILMSFESSLFYFRIGVFACVIWYLIEQDKKILSYFN